MRPHTGRTPDPGIPGRGLLVADWRRRFCYIRAPEMPGNSFGDGASSPRWISGLAFYCVLGTVLFFSHGHYYLRAIVVLTAAFLPLAAAWLLDRPRLSFDSAVVRDRAASAALIVFSLLLTRWDGLLSAQPGPALAGLRAATLLVCGWTFVRLWPAAGSRLRHRGDAAAAALLVFGQVLTLFASPRPTIDVFTITTAALDHLAAGRNPYPQTYFDIYGGRYGYAASPNYWPGLFYALLPFRVLIGDFRFGFVAANALCAWLLARLARPSTVPDGAGARDALLWLSFPVSFFVLEQAWIDSLLILALAGIAHCLVRRRWVAAGICAGLLLGTKQYGLIAVWITLWYAWRADGPRAALRFGAWAAAAFGACVIPFLLWDSQSFLLYSVRIYLEQPLRADSLSWPTFFLNELRWVPPGGVRSALGLAGFALVIPLSLLNRRPEPVPADWAAALALAYAWTFFETKNAFCNYYALIAFLFVLTLTLLSAAGKRPAPGATRA
ncbi:MAG: hypothetical protein NVSMB23_21390 [Myxococcales bacterium]